jgi:hypothetical protein
LLSIRAWSPGNCSISAIFLECRRQRCTCLMDDESTEIGNLSVCVEGGATQPQTVRPAVAHALVSPFPTVSFYHQNFLWLHCHTHTSHRTETDAARRRSHSDLFLISVKCGDVAVRVSRSTASGRQCTPSWTWRQPPNALSLHGLPKRARRMHADARGRAPEPPEGKPSPPKWDCNFLTSRPHNTY